MPTERSINKCLGCRAFKEIRKRLKDPAYEWTVSPTPTVSPFGVQLVHDNVRVIVFPNERCPCQRLFDQVRLTVNNADFPLSPGKRLLLRKAARERTQYELSKSV